MGAIGVTGCRLPPVIAEFTSSVDVPVATAGGGAGCETGVRVIGVAVVTGFAGLNKSITAASRNAGS